MLRRLDESEAKALGAAPSTDVMDTVRMAWVDSLAVVGRLVPAIV